MTTTPARTGSTEFTIEEFRFVRPTRLPVWVSLTLSIDYTVSEYRSATRDDPAEGGEIEDWSFAVTHVGFESGRANTPRDLTDADAAFSKVHEDYAAEIVAACERHAA